ncbi:DNA-3-methyladenine glycosylase I [Pokkaliibacter sp. CJK22405]|uniref:DNA-3-methyladenine glycosylase I n=1 Tax=Pokkaliibacter sp. CJK22405 TaxID=3384615 RepID=UPI0039848569
MTKLADTTLVQGDDQRYRCDWSGETDELRRYHDEEWGFPVLNDRHLFEKLCLETFQCGLSWRTVLNKRPALREAFADFDWQRMAAFTETDSKRLLANPAIIRHPGKINAVLNNARQMPSILAEFGSLARFLWRFEPDENTLPPPRSQTVSAESKALAKALKQRGWRFVGPTTAYAFLQSMGMINDHVEGCCIRSQVAQARAALIRP